jgi:hypothetical protein
MGFLASCWRRLYDVRLSGNLPDPGIALGVCEVDRGGVLRNWGHVMRGKTLSKDIQSLPSEVVFLSS